MLDLAIVLLLVASSITFAAGFYAGRRLAVAHSRQAQQAAVIDESAAARAEFLAAKALIKCVNEMLAHPEARSLLLNARKIADPTCVIPGDIPELPTVH